MHSTHTRNRLKGYSKHAAQLGYIELGAVPVSEHETYRLLCNLRGDTLGIGMAASKTPMPMLCSQSPVRLCLLLAWLRLMLFNMSRPLQCSIQCCSVIGACWEQPCLSPARPPSFYPWFDSRRAAWCTQSRHTKCLFPNSHAVQLLGRQYQTQLRHSRAQHNQRQVADLSQLLDSNLRKFWQQACLPHLLRPPDLQHPSAWDYFITNLTAPPAQLASQLPAPHIEQPPIPADCLNQPLSLAEVETGIQHANNGRSPAMLGYSSELLHYAKLSSNPEDPAPPHLLAPCLQALLNAAFSTGQVPQSWKSSLVTPIFTKGDAADTANYKPIAADGPISRLCSSILAQRPVQCTEEQQLRSLTQAGYRPDLGTLHLGFALQHAVDKQKHAKQPLYLCFVDLKSAYDNVQWPLLWRSFQRLGIHVGMHANCHPILCMMAVCCACGSVAAIETPTPLPLGSGRAAHSVLPSLASSLIL